MRVRRDGEMKPGPGSTDKEDPPRKVFLSLEPVTFSESSFPELSIRDFVSTLVAFVKSSGTSGGWLTGQEHLPCR